MLVIDIGKPHDHFYEELNLGLGEPNGVSFARGYQGAFHPGKTLRHSYPQQRPLYAGTFNNRTGPSSYWSGASGEAVLAKAKPKVVTIVRSGPKPHSTVKILLNRRSVQSFKQLMKDIAEAFGVKSKTNRVRRLYNIRGREVMSVSDFFRDDEVFIGVGMETLTTSDVQDVLEELYPNSPYAKNLLREWEKAWKKQHKLRTGADKDDGNDSKIDSGLGSDSSHRDDTEEGGHRRKGLSPRKSQKFAYEQDSDLVLRLERERMRAAEGERERTRRRMQKKIESERRALDDEKRRQGLVPLKPVLDPFRKMEVKRREREERHMEEIRRKLAMGQKPKILPIAENSTPNVIIVVKGDDNMRKTSPRKHKEKHSDTAVNSSDEDDGIMGSSRTSKLPSVARTESTNARTYRSETDEPSKNVANTRKATPKRVHSNVADDDANKENQVSQETAGKKKKPKAKVVYRTRFERQVSNADPILKKYDLGKVIGDGNFAVVKQCKLKNTSSEYAMKVMDKAKLKGKEHMVENEIAIMKECNHPNIVRLIEEFETPGEIYLVMELVKGGDLFDAITQSVKFNEVDSSRMVADMASALFYLHSRSIVHRDLKPENVLVYKKKDGTMTLKLADFGLAMEVKEPIYTVCGTPTYVAPEILSEIGELSIVCYGLEVDTWALGVITYILLCGFPPFRSPDRNQTELFEFIKAGVYEFLSPYWDNTSRGAKDLIKKLLVVSKKQRYTAIDVLCHPWVITEAETMAPSGRLDDHRKNLRNDLTQEAKRSLDSYNASRPS
ncbi:hypothetical protein NP493_1310g00030 [Ridgeia piscesae]|uniref:non-specific serine/threonine protein kinase n=1 Tax=Ridgeia piscesae TaxID=27915 RepID=A0AAD9K8K6_RIDPI|nr:hypothetical protein NP493_1310g00030 [Ridgeia piscesae]